MTIKRTSRPRDPVQLGKLMLDIATGAVPDGVDDGKSLKAVEAGKIGGRSGGKVRAASLTPERKVEIAKTAAKARWKASADSE